MNNSHKTNELQNFYLQLEEVNSLEYWDLDAHLKPLEGIYLDDLRENILNFRFYLNNGNLHSFFESVNDNGGVTGFPELNAFENKK